jgi:HEAT repeat protein
MAYGLILTWSVCLLVGGTTSRPTTTQATTRPAGSLPPAEEARVQNLVAQLGAAEGDVQLGALDTLRDVGLPAAPYVGDGLRDHSEAVRAGAARALGVLGADAAGRRLNAEQQALRDAMLEPLVNALGDGGGSVRISAARALGELGETAARQPEAVPALVKVLSDPESAARANAALSLGQIARAVGERPGASPAAAAAERAAVARAALTGLIDALRDPEAAVRSHAAISLGALKDPRALAPLLLLSADPEPLCRASACQGLGDLSDRAAGGVLVDLLQDDDATVRRSAIEALERLTGSTLGFKPRGTDAERREAVLRWQTWWARTRRELQP